MRWVSAILAVSAWLILPIPAQERPAGAKARSAAQASVFTNADLPPPLPVTGASAAAVQASLSPAPAPAPARVAQFQLGEPRDQNGHGEGWWRQRAAEFDLKIYDAWVTAQTVASAWRQGSRFRSGDASQPAASRRR